MKILMVLTSHENLGDTGKKRVFDWRNLLRHIMRLKMLVLTLP